MLRPRIIPCLLVHNKGLVKTVCFKEPKYVGDPINAVRIFNEKQVDELMVLDIDATVKGIAPDFQMIEYLAAECRMPLAYGGGVRTVEQAQRIFSLGVEKIAISAGALETPSLVSDIANVVGSQSVVVVVDVRQNKRGEYEVYTHNGTKRVVGELSEVIRRCDANGAGEIIVNSIDHDGVMQGYDMVLADIVTQWTTLPLTVLGGAGSIQHLKELIARYGVIGAAAGSLFVFKGVYKAVLISYPSAKEKNALIHQSPKPLNQND